MIMNINGLNFTLFENNLKWNKLSTGVIKTDIFTNNLKMDIILNENILIDFIHILENKTLNKYIINIKETIVKKTMIFILIMLNLTIL